jgi:hypothetical protein
MEQTENKKTKHPWYKSPWVIGWLILLLTVLLVNFFMIFQSVNDYPGLVVDDFYERGQDYEENILDKLEQNQKWKTDFVINTIHHNKPALINFKITDKQDVLPKVDKLTLFAYRPADAKKDFSVPMTFSADQQNYIAEVTFTAKGTWDLLASVIIDGKEVNYAKRIFVED